MYLPSFVLAACGSLPFSTGLYLSGDRTDAGLRAVTPQSDTASSLVAGPDGKPVENAWIVPGGLRVRPITGDDSADRDGHAGAARVEDRWEQVAGSRWRPRTVAGDSRTPPDGRQQHEGSGDITNLDRAEVQRRDDTQREHRLVRRGRGRGRGRAPGTSLKDLQVLMDNPEVARIAGLGKHSLEEVAMLRREWLDAANELDRAKRRDPPDPEQLRTLRDAFNARNLVWRNIQQGLPPDTPHKIQGRKMLALDDLTRDSAVLAAAETSGRPVDEVAAIKRHYLDARTGVRRVEAELAEARGRGDPSALPEIERRLREAQNVLNQRLQAWKRARRMSTVRAGRKPKSLAEVMTDPDVIAAAQRHGLSVEEVAATKKLFYDARAPVRRLQAELAEMQKTGDAEAAQSIQTRLRKAMDAFNTYQQTWHNLRRGPNVQHGRARNDLADLMKEREVLSVAAKTQRRVSEVASIKRRYLDARAEVSLVRAGLEKAIARNDVATKLALEEKLRLAREQLNKHQAAWTKLRGGRGRLDLPQDSPQASSQVPPQAPSQMPPQMPPQLPPQAPSQAPSKPPAQVPLQPPPQSLPQVPPQDPVSGGADADLQRVYNEYDRHKLAQRKVQQIDDEVQQARTRVEQIQARLRQAEQDVERCKAELECQRRDLEAHEAVLVQAWRELHVAENRALRAVAQWAKQRSPVTSEDDQSSTSPSVSTEENRRQSSREKGFQAFSVANVVPTVLDARRRLSQQIQHINPNTLKQDGQATINHVKDSLFSNPPRFVPPVFAPPNMRGLVGVRAVI